MKIVGVDNLARETVADILWLDGIRENCASFAAKVCDKLNEGLNNGSGTFYCLKPDSYRLSRGMDDLI